MKMHYILHKFCIIKNLEIAVPETQKCMELYWIVCNSAKLLYFDLTLKIHI